MIAANLTDCGLAKVAFFTTNVDAENQTLINYKTGCGALNRHFCQTPVMPSPFFLGHYLSVQSPCVCAVGQTHYLPNFGLCIGL
jgi:hypothetical protein